MARCKSCGTEIVWKETENGRPMPFDEMKTKVIIDDQIVDGRVSHFTTCPDAGRWSGSSRSGGP